MNIDVKNRSVTARRTGATAAVVVTVSGELDIYTAPQLHHTLDEVFTTSAAANRSTDPPTRSTPGDPGDPSDTTRSQVSQGASSEVIGLVVDLGEVTFMDSSGLGVLVAAYKRAHSRGWGYAPVTARENIIKMFMITGLTTVMQLHEDVQVALTQLRADTAA